MANLLICCLLVLAVAAAQARPDKRPKFADRSYQLSPVAVVNGAQGVQYFATGPVYPALQSVLIPAQLSSQIPDTSKNVAVSPAVNKPSYYHDTSTPGYASHLHHKTRGYKRPNSYQSLGVKPAGLSAYHSGPKGSSSFTVQQSVDLSDHAPFPTPTPVLSTYGPPKPQSSQSYKKSSYGGSHMYHRHKGFSLRQPYWGPKHLRGGPVVYTHMHNGHFHNHYIPSPSYSTPLYKTHYSSKPTTATYPKPPSTYLPPTTESATYNPYKDQVDPAEHAGNLYNYHAHPKPDNSNFIRFPEKPAFEQSSDEAFAGHLGQAGLTEAIIGEQGGAINNHDALLPVKIPSQKPNHFKVNEILQNADFHIATEDPQAQLHSPHSPVLHYQPVHHLPFTDGQVFGFRQPNFQTFTLEQPSSVQNHLESYQEPRDSIIHSYPSNHLLQEQPLEAESVKIPVAVLQGIHSTHGQGMFAVTAVKRSDDVDGSSKSSFTPSRASSDWIPMTGGGLLAIPMKVQDTQKAPATGLSFGDNFFADLSKAKTRTKKDESNQVVIGPDRKVVGDIISGKIPEEFSPYSPYKTTKEQTVHVSGTRDSSVVSSSLSFGNERDRRKGTVLDDFPPAGAGEAATLQAQKQKFGDSSDLVVSSIIKFS